MAGNDRKMNGPAFVNPYTFVPYDRKKKSERKQEGTKQDEEKITGYLDCLLTIKTPLAIPDVEPLAIPDVEQQEKLENGSTYYPFFSIEKGKEKQYRIPASSIRGMLRNIYETATNSCFSTMRDKTMLSKRADVREGYRAGLLIRDRDTGEWKLYEAKKYLIPYVEEENKWNYLKENGIIPEYNCIVIAGERVLVSKKDKSKKIYYGDPVEFKLVQRIPLYKPNGYPVWAGIIRTLKSYEDAKSEADAYAFVGESFSRKHGEEVFKKGNEVQEFSSDEIRTALDLLKESLEMYRNESVNKEYKTNHFGYAGFERAERNGAIPLWYSVKTMKFSFAYAGRTTYRTTLNQLVGESKPCKSRNTLCKACELFGMVGNGVEALGSRIRVTDGEFEGEHEKTLPKVILKELAMPKNSYMKFYSMKEKNGNGIVPAQSYDNCGIDIRGRKFYWHHGLNEEGKLEKRDYEASEEDLKEKKKRERLHAFELMEQGAFRFRIYYDDITQTQLSELMWCITLGENCIDSYLWHKIGNGKPLGLGSCKLTISKRLDRDYQDQGNRFSLKCETDPERLTGKLKEEGEWKMALLKVCNAQAVSKQTVCYPYIQKPKDVKGKPNSAAPHQWFKKNGKALPYIMDEDQTFSVNVEDTRTYRRTESKGYKHNKRYDTNRRS